MQTTLLLVAISIFGGVFGSRIHQESDDYSDPPCTGNIKNLWLDVMVVVDKSAGMTNAQLWQVRNTITTVFGAVGVIGPVKYPADPRSSCVGLITYDTSARVNAQLDAAHSFSDLYNNVQGALVAVDSTNTSYLSTGLLAAEQAFKDGRHRTYRFNFKKVIIAFVAAYQGSGTPNDALPIANRLKNDEYVTIITVACTQDPAQMAAISAIASFGMAFVDDMNTSKLATQLTNALVDTNCYCAEDYTQLRTDFSNTTSSKLATCVKGYKATGGSWGYQHAIDYCRNSDQQAHLANEFSQSKHDFLRWYMQDEFPRFAPLEYYIGLRYWYGQWVWEQPQGQDKIPLTTTGYTAWAPGFPQTNSTDQVIATQPVTNGSDTFVWRTETTFDWLFVCQVKASSTENYRDWLMN